MEKFKKGFTLGELLTTIAIAGILGSIALASIKPLQERGRIQAAYITASSIIAPANGCMEDKKPLSETSGVPVVGTKLCTGATDAWPAFADTQWEWYRVENNASNNTFRAYAVETAPSKVGCITCTIFACSKDLAATCPAP